MELRSTISLLCGFMGVLATTVTALRKGGDVQGGSGPIVRKASESTSCLLVLLYLLYLRQLAAT